ncbi:MAG: hypothetical protein AABY90_06820, partial [Nitrospirota bacterium]
VGACRVRALMLASLSVACERATGPSGAVASSFVATRVGPNGWATRTRFGLASGGAGLEVARRRRVCGAVV